MGINESVKSRNVSNYGVEDTWVHAAVVNETGSGQNKTSTVNDPADWRKSDSSWFTTANSNDRYVNGVDTKWDKDFNREKLDDPLTSIVGKVKNGYTNPCIEIWRLVMCTLCLIPERQNMMIDMPSPAISL